MRPDAIMNKIKESQACEPETFEKQYIIDDASLDMEDVGGDDWMFQTKKWVTLEEKAPEVEETQPSKLDVFLEKTVLKVEQPPPPHKPVEEDSHVSHKAKY